MDYWRRYIGDYLAKTQGLTLIEDGAYTRMLDYYYANESPLPVSKREIYEIVRASTAAARQAVDRVLERKFTLQQDGWHNDRADRELAIALPAMDAKARVARENGKKGGRPKKTRVEPTQVLDKPVDGNPEANPEITDAGSEAKPVSVPTRASQATPSPQPPTEVQTLPSEKRFPGRDGTPGTAAAFGAAALSQIEPPGPEADVRTAGETPAGLLAAVCQRNGIQANAFHPLVVEWARDGFTVDQLKAAIASAREPQRKGDGRIPLAYLDPILRDAAASKPKPSAWKTDDAAATALCAELGIKPAKQGETREEWHRRIERAIGEQARRKVA